MTEWRDAVTGGAWRAFGGLGLVAAIFAGVTVATDAAKTAEAAETAAEVNRTPWIILEDSGDMLFAVSKETPCTSAEQPAIIVTAASRPVDYRSLFRMVNAADVTGVCRFPPGTPIHFIQQVGAVAVARGSVTAADLSSFEQDLRVTALAAPPAETPFGALLATSELSDEALPARLADLHAQSANPAEKARIAWLLYQLVRGRDAEAVARRDAYLAEALAADNPAASYAAAGEFVELVYQATTPGDPRRSEAMAQVGAAATGKAAQMLLAAAEAGYAPAIQALQRAADNGWSVTRRGMVLADVPSDPDIERAILARLSREAQLHFWMLPGYTHCDENWCYVPPGNRYRFKVRQSACSATGPDLARCVLTYGFISNNMMVGDGFFGNKITHAMSRDSARMQIDVARAGTTWEITQLSPLQ